MNRAEIRRMEKKNKKASKTYILTQADIDAMKNKMTVQVADELLAKVLGISVMIVHDKFPKLMRRLEEGKTMEQRFSEMFMDLYEAFEQGYLTLDDIKQTLRDECGIVIHR